jgi:hypothetical protein
VNLSNAALLRDVLLCITSQAFCIDLIFIIFLTIYPEENSKEAQDKINSPFYYGIIISDIAYGGYRTNPVYQTLAYAKSRLRWYGVERQASSVFCLCDKDHTGNVVILTIRPQYVLTDQYVNIYSDGEH